MGGAIGVAAQVRHMATNKNNDNDNNNKNNNKK